MATFVHPTKYRFYAQRYPDGDTEYPKKDIEETYNCRYMKFSNLFCDGKITNMYKESYSEASGARIYIPPKSDLAFDAKDCKLKLFFKGGDVQSRVRQFIEDYRGIKIEWSDTFRKRYATLVMSEEPSIEQEKLYGSESYMVVEFTFTNVLGKTFAESQI